MSYTERVVVVQLVFALPRRLFALTYPVSDGGSPMAAGLSNVESPSQGLAEGSGAAGEGQGGPEASLPLRESFEPRSSVSSL